VARHRQPRQIGSSWIDTALHGGSLRLISESFTAPHWPRDEPVAISVAWSNAARKVIGTGTLRRQGRRRGPCDGLKSCHRMHIPNAVFGWEKAVYFESRLAERDAAVACAFAVNVAVLSSASSRRGYDVFH